MEDSSDDEEEGGGDEGGGEDDDWGPDDDALASSVHEVPIAEVGGETQEASEPRHSNRENRGVPPLRFIEAYLATAADEEVKQSPESVQEALQGPQREKWQQVMNSEMESLRENGVYELVDRPKGKKVVKSKWVLRVKTTCTRPDLAAAVSELSKFNQNPGVTHWEGVKRVLRYLSGIVGEGLMYKRGA